MFDVQFHNIPFSETITVSTRQNDLFGVTVTKLMDVFEQRMAISSGKFFSYYALCFIPCQGTKPFKHPVFENQIIKLLKRFYSLKLLVKDYRLKCYSCLY